MSFNLTRHDPDARADLAGNEANLPQGNSGELFVERVGLKLGLASFDGFVKPGILISIGVALFIHIRNFRQLGMFGQRQDLFRLVLLHRLLANIKSNLTYRHRVLIYGLAVVGVACIERLDVECKFFLVTHPWRLLFKIILNK